MKREDLIKLITDNFAEGEEVSFRYCDQHGNYTTISTKAFFDVDKTETVEDCFWTLFDLDGNIISDHVSDKDFNAALHDAVHDRSRTYSYSKRTVIKTKTKKTKVIDVVDVISF